jgi:hypothetical protein
MCRVLCSTQQLEHIHLRYAAPMCMKSGRMASRRLAIRKCPAAWADVVGSLDMLHWLSERIWGDWGDRSAQCRREAANPTLLAQTWVESRKRKQRTHSHKMQPAAGLHSLQSPSQPPAPAPPASPHCTPAVPGTHACLLSGCWSACTQTALCELPWSSSC